MTLSTDQLAEIAAARANPQATLRPVSPYMEEILHTPFEVLDHGFIRVVDYLGDDAAVVQAARVSYGPGTKHVSNDEGLIRYLMRHWHTTPFEMCEVKIHVKMPIFVARQWIRHRMANVNEISARYSILDREFYIPAPEHLAAQSQVNNQGRGQVLEGEEAARVLQILKEDANRAYDNYEQMMSQDGQAGLARELARMNLPTNIMTQWYWKVDVKNFSDFIRLRADPHAQYEIRVYADVLHKILQGWMPATARAVEDYRMNAVSVSAQGVECIRKMIAGQPVAREDSGLSQREWDDLMVSFT